MECDPANPADRYFLEAYHNAWLARETIGPAWQNNPYGLSTNNLIRHGRDKILELSWAETGHLEGDSDFGWKFVHHQVLSLEMIRDYLKTHKIEGIVFWLDGQPLCKIKRSDFGFEWPIKKELMV